MCVCVCMYVCVCVCVYVCVYPPPTNWQLNSNEAIIQNVYRMLIKEKHFLIKIHVSSVAIRRMKTSI